MKERFFAIKLISMTMIGFLFSSSNLFSQSNFVSLGASINAQQGNVSYSIGQAAFVNSKTSGGTIEFGVQQPYQYIAITSVPNTSSFLDIQIFPNPTHEILAIKNLTRLMSSGRLNVQVINQSGQIITEEVILNEQIEIDVRKFTPGIYFLNILQKDKFLKTYKFIKL